MQAMSQDFTGSRRSGRARLLTLVAGTLVCATVSLAACKQAPAQKAPAATSWASVDQALGRGGMTQPDGVRRYSFPRSDLSVQLDGVRIKPALALGSWLAFEPASKSAMVMGDLVLTQDEVNPVMSELLKDGISVTAVHNHLLRSSPLTMYMHVEGHGAAATLAHALHTALALSKTPLGPPAAAAQTLLDIDVAALDQTMAEKGKVNGGVYQFTIPRPEKIVDGDMTLGASMGTGTAINFQPLGGGRAAATGDFVLLSAEVGPTMRALKSAGIEITALHSHMLDEKPKLYFMHFWAVGDAKRLAAGLRSALNRTHMR
jgi:hypothetical protein